MEISGNQITIDNGSSYCLITPPNPTSDTIIFAPGMACNEFGHPFANEPKGVIADLLGIFTPNYNILLPDINDMHDNNMKFYVGKTVEQQAERIASAYKDAFNGERLNGKTLFIGQSLGSLAIANFICHYSVSSETNAIFLAPPTYNGKKCHESLVAMFINNIGTNVDENCVGILNFGENQHILVDEEYWQSIDRNSLSFYKKQIQEKFQRTLALYAINDKYFPDSKEYLGRELPDIDSFPIYGNSHTFKTDSMRQQVIDVVRNFL